MKKIFISLLAIAALASCAKTEDVFTEGESEIMLSPVATLQTKANHLGAIDGIKYPTEENFDVYAYWKNVPAGQEFTDGSLFLQSLTEGGAEFTNKGVYWGGIDKYYWPKNGSLRFAAYSPAHLTVAHEQVNDVYSISYEQPSETAKTWDFLVAPTSPSYSMMTATEKVAIEFQHALSWLTLKVVAKDADAAKAFDIKKVTILDVNTKADFAASMTDGIQYEEWSNQNTTADYVVFEGSQAPTVTPTDIENTVAGTIVIPQNTTTVRIEFDQYGLNGTADTPGMVVDLDLVLDGDNQPWEPGKHYNYTLVFGLDEILINPSVTDWEEVEVGTLEPGATNVSTAAQLEAALANPETTKIVFQADIAGQFNVPEAAKTLTIDGNGYKFDGTFNLVGNSSYTNGNTVFENINFETADASALTGESFIYCAEQNGNTRYPDSVTINNCTFTATGAAEKAAVGAKFRSLKGVVAIEGTTATGMHSLLQMLSCGEAEVAINDVTIENGKNGISLQHACGTISNTTIEAAEYGVRADGADATLNVVKSTIKAEKPIIVRKVTKAGFVLNLDKKTVLETAEDYEVIFTQGNDDAAYVAPTVGFTYNGPKTVKVYPATTSSVDSVEELASALSNVSNVNFEAPIDNGSNVVSINDNYVVINMAGEQYNGGGNGTNNYAFNLYGSEVEVNDANIVGAGFAVMSGSELTVNSGSIAATPGKSGRNLFYVSGNSTVTVNEGTYTFDRTSCYFVYVAAGCTCYINGGHYEKPLANNASKDAFVNTASEGTVVITGGTFNVDPTQWLAEGYKAVKSGKIWTVSAE